MSKVSKSHEIHNGMFANRSFQRTVKVLRRILPTLSFGLLAAVYVISALAAGMFLSRHLVDFGTFGYWLAFGIGGGIQMVRGAIVFFSQLNPGRPQFGANWGPAIAVIMAVASIIEIYMLSSDLGLPLAPVISLAILMAAGLVIELFLLREVQYATQLELFRDRDRWDELRNFYVARADFEAMMDELEEGNLLQQPAQSAAPTLPAGRRRTLKELQEKHEEIMNMKDGQSPNDEPMKAEPSDTPPVTAYDEFELDEDEGVSVPFDIGSLNGNGKKH